MRILTPTAVCTVFLALAALLAPAPAEAGKIDRDFPFQLGEWMELEVVDGPVTIHRIRIEVVKSNIKSHLFRPTNTEFLETIQIQIDYTNDSNRDYEADLDIVWLDSSGAEIDGFRDEEDIDEDERDTITATLSTLKYGLEQAKTLHVGMDF